MSYLFLLCFSPYNFHLSVFVITIGSLTVILLCFVIITFISFVLSLQLLVLSVFVCIDLFSQKGEKNFILKKGQAIIIKNSNNSKQKLFSLKLGIFKFESDKLFIYFYFILFYYG